jgi:hypothetical protein
MAHLHSNAVAVAIALVAVLLDGCASSKPPRVKCSGSLERINAPEPAMDKADEPSSDAEGVAP